MNDEPNELDGFLSEVCETVERDALTEGIEPDFEAMLARARALAGDGDGDATPERGPASEPTEHDPPLADFVSEVSGHLHSVDEPVPDFLAVVSRAHAIAPDVIPQAAVDEVGHYAPIISLQHAGRLKTGQHDAALDTFVDDVRGHVDQELVREGATADEAANDTGRRRGIGLALAAGFVLALGLGAGLAQTLDLGRGLWSPQTDAPSEAMLSPQPAAEQESELANRSGRADDASEPEPPEPEPPEPEPRAPEPQEPEPLAVEPEPQVDAGPRPTRRPRTRPAAKPPSRRDRLAALERDANAAWQAGKLDKAESAFRKIIAIDGRGSWGESAYGDLFTLQRQRSRSSVALWKAYLKRFPEGRFADDARAGLCRRAADDAKAQCWGEYLDVMPRGSFRSQAQREVDRARKKDPP